LLGYALNLFSTHTTPNRNHAARHSSQVERTPISKLASFATIAARKDTTNQIADPRNEIKKANLDRTEDNNNRLRNQLVSSSTKADHRLIVSREDRL
jgi:hypothetical protein